MAHYNRRDALCRSCFSEERHRALRLFLQSWLPTDGAPIRVLHLAPEPVLRSWLEGHQGVHYVSADLSRPRVALRLDLEHIPCSDESFDVVIATHVLEHVHSDRGALAEIVRILRPGGSLIAMVPIDATREATFDDPSIVTPAAREAAYWQSDHVRLYGRDFASRVADSGFTVTLEQPSVQMTPEAVRRHGLSADPAVSSRYPIAPPDEIYVATRPHRGE